MRPEPFVIAAFVCLAIAGCGDTNQRSFNQMLRVPMPGCGDEKTLNLVKEIIQREAAAKDVGELFENFTLEYVTTTAHDKELDSYSCSAHLVMFDKSTEEKVTLPITFDVNPLATDPTQFVVQVFGL